MCPVALTRRPVQWEYIFSARELRVSTETAVPYAAFKKAGFSVSFATEHGQSPACDKLMLEGLTQKLLVCFHGSDCPG